MQTNSTCNATSQHKENDGRSGTAAHKGRLCKLSRVRGCEPWKWAGISGRFLEGCAGTRGWVRRLVLKGRLTYESAAVDCIYPLFLRGTRAGGATSQALSPGGGPLQSLQPEGSYTDRTRTFELRGGVPQPCITRSYACNVELETASSFSSRAKARAGPTLYLGIRGEIHTRKRFGYLHSAAPVCLLHPILIKDVFFFQ